LDGLTALFASLDALLREAVEEDDFQAWFESNPAVFEILGFKRSIIKPRLMLGDGKYLEPDFLVQDHVGVWSVFELKRPDTIILKNPDRRTDFRAEFSTYIQQCREYANFFVQSTGRRQIQNDYSIDVQMYVPSIIVACVDDGETDRDTLRELLVDRGNKVTVQTYTEILDSIGREIDRHTADRANLPGIAVSLLGMFPAKPSVTDQVILDYGIDEFRNRLTIRLADGTFVIVLVDSEGKAHRSEIRRPMVVEFANANELTLLEVEFGVGAEGSYLGLFVNRRCLLAKFTERIHVNPGTLSESVLGSDMHGRTPAHFAIIELVTYARTLSWRERLQLHAHFQEVYAYYLSPLAIHSPITLLFSGNKFMATPAHPLTPGGTSASKPKVNPGGLTSWYVVSGGVTPSDGSPAPVDPRLGAQTTPVPGQLIEQ